MPVAITVDRKGDKKEEMFQKSAWWDLARNLARELREEELKTMTYLISGTMIKTPMVGPVQRETLTWAMCLQDYRALSSVPRPVVMFILQLTESQSGICHSCSLLFPDCVFSWPLGAPHCTCISFLEFSWQSSTNQTTEKYITYSLIVLKGDSSESRGCQGSSSRPSAPISPLAAFVAFGILWSITA